MAADGTSAMRPVPWFLATIPVARPDMLPRRTISRLLDAECDRKRAIVVAAPSGYGKTVALSQWAAERTANKPGSVAWLTLTVRVANRDDVLRGLLTAMGNSARAAGDDGLGRQIAEVAEVLQTSSYPSAVAALMEIDPLGPLTVVIDDFQQARAAWREADVFELIELGPPWLSFVLATTDSVGPEWSRLRVHGQVAVIGANDLAFTHDDIAALALQSGIPVEDVGIEEISVATGGWPAAVRLMLVSGSAPSSVSSADLTEYLETAVLSRLRRELADFVLSATVCARLDERLAVALSGRADAVSLLRECVGSGLFVEQFGAGESTFYQWHAIFVRHCREILRRTRPGEWQRLNRIAAVELAATYPLEAVECAIRGSDPRAGFEIIADHWLELLLQSRSDALDDACARLNQAFGENPEVLMVRASCRAMAGDSVAAALLFDRARSAATAGADPRRMEFIADLCTILVADDRGAMAAAAARAEAVLGDRDVVAPRAYACALFVIGWADSRLRRGPSRGSAYLESSVHECTAQGLTEVAHRARQNLAFAAAHAGEFDRALAALQSAQAVADPSPELWLSHDGDGIERFTAGWISLWRGQMDVAVDYLVSVSASVGVGYPDTGRMMLAFAAATLGVEDVLGVAEATVRRMPDLDTHGVPWNSYKTASRARLAEARGRRQEALDAAASIVGREHVPMISAVLSGMCRRLADPDLADRLARQALAVEAPVNVEVYALLTLALLDWEQGRAAAAHRGLETVLGLAREERVRYQFVDNADSVCRELLAAHLPTTAHQEFLAEALVLVEQPKAVSSASALTPRELEVLAHLRTAMTSQEIADWMGVSLNTLKTHQRSIYRKLAVANRREAIRAVRP
ncbi:LuxR C-terminal-related transcriptional regulator [Mycobacterium sp. SMC-16]|uniref:helix-turn-helix transcriptional regulator n=1 Tax=Mycobacteriaceae TaxID=1762 RepID=UPI00226A1A8C|nr:LuxR C-terminal-related transcriptional regulator [Mycolicibacterium mucogenicum]MCX8554555.1 LuxR C-terminal-related transcriptional regulator [Mycolicibacterium mucogenicum]